MRRSNSLPNVRTQHESPVKEFVATLRILRELSAIDDSERYGTGY